MRCLLCPDVLSDEPVRAQTISTPALSPLVIHIFRRSAPSRHHHVAPSCEEHRDHCQLQPRQGKGASLELSRADLRNVVCFLLFTAKLRNDLPYHVGDRHCDCSRSAPTSNLNQRQNIRHYPGLCASKLLDTLTPISPSQRGLSATERENVLRDRCLQPRGQCAFGRSLGPSVGSVIGFH